MQENVGASARAMKTMGFENLRLVNPCDFLSERAKWMAHGSVDILEKAAVYSNLRDAFQEMDLTVATTNRKRNIQRNYYDSEELIKLIRKKGSLVKNLGLVSGRENNGLTSSELMLCDLISTIPMKGSFPSLNLAQSVMVYAYSLSSLNIEISKQKENAASDEKLLVIKKTVADLLARVGVAEKDVVASRIRERLACLRECDLKLLHFISKKINQKLNS